MPLIKATRNDFKLFATAQNANVLSNASYATSLSLGPGVKVGVASAALYNKTLRQLSLISVSLASYLQERLGEDIVDDGTTATIIGQIKRAIGEQAKEDVVIPIGSLTQKGILQLSNLLSDKTPNEKAATIGVVSDLDKRITNIEKMLTNNWTSTPENPYNPIYDIDFPVGSVKLFSTNVDPSVLYPGTTWKRVNPGSTLRTAKEDASDLNKYGGKDDIVLESNNIPPHVHAVSLTSTAFDYGTKTVNNTDLGSPGSTGHDYGTVTSSTFDHGTKYTSEVPGANLSASSFDYGTKGSSVNGAHTHTMNLTRGYLQSNASTNTPEGVWGNQETAAAGDHSHTIYIGAHSHTVWMPAHSHSVVIGAHSHTSYIGAHSHTVPIGAHGHTVGIGSHSHSVVGNTGSVGAGYGFSVVNKYYGLVAWIRTK